MTQRMIKRLKKLGWSAGIIAAFAMAATQGMLDLKRIGSYFEDKIQFPESGIVKNIVDGDTFDLEIKSVRMLGIDVLGDNSEEIEFLTSLVFNKKVWLEYDRYQDDKYGRILAWVWINCESNPKFTPAEYMHLSGNASKPGLTDNPEGCKKGKMVQEELVKAKLAKTVVYADRGELKYQKRLGVLDK